MNKKRVFQILVLVILISWFAVYFYQNIDNFKQIKIVNPFYILPLGIFVILFLISNGLILKYLLDPFKIKLKPKEWFGLSVITSMGNYLTPFRGGAMAKAIYLKKVYQFPYSYFLSTLAGIYVIMFLVYSFVGLIAMFFLYHSLEIFNVLIFVVFLVVFLSLLGIVIFSPKIKESKYSFINKFIKVFNGLHLIKSNKRSIRSIGLISLIMVGIMVLRIFLEFKVFGLEISFLSALFLSIVSILGSFISITPGALGIREAMVVFTATVMNIPASQVLAVSILDRVIILAVIFILGPIFSYILMNRKNDKNEGNNI
ncbi:MAG: lysylphosphatidylglycerol synthase transmembrane domain-containing protein [Candidatus Pacebacteria bacterium]|nr:lysylphosphatidylglycerol synthase transmembrane domain-containing protein [Candidatus Paceibacterota bacterium]